MLGKGLIGADAFAFEALFTLIQAFEVKLKLAAKLTKTLNGRRVLQKKCTSLF